MTAPDPRTRVLTFGPDVFFARTEEGVWLRNNAGSVNIAGDDAYDLIRFLFGRFDGNRTVEEAWEGLDPAQRRALDARLVEPLLEEGFLAEVPPDRQEPPDWMADRFADSLAFLRRHVDAPVERMREIRSRQVVCLGRGRALRAVVVALADLGFGRVRVVATGADTGLIERLLQEVAAADSRAEWSLDARPGSALDDLDVTGPAEAAVVAVDGSDGDEVSAASRALRRDGVAVAVVAPAGSMMAASPVLDDQAWCWECLRLASAETGTASSAAPAAASVAALLASQRLFCRLAGPPVPRLDRRLTTVDPRSLAVTVHDPRRHPACPRHGATGTAVSGPNLRLDDAAPVRPDVPSPADRDEVVAAQDEIVETVESWTDDLTGPFVDVGEADLPQIPLSASRCRWGAITATGTRDVECRAVSAREARNQAVLFALESMAAASAKELGDDASQEALASGWSESEAVYRAWISAALDELGADGDGEVRIVETGDLPSTPLRAFLRETLAHSAGASYRVELAEVPLGLPGARLVGEGGETLGEGVGVTPGRAVDQALLDGVARRTAEGGADEVVTARLAPPDRAWSAALRRVRSQVAGTLRPVDASPLLPFVGGGACLVRLVGDRRSATSPSG